jgi:FMN reductase
MMERFPAKGTRMSGPAGPFVIGIGGTLRLGSSTEMALVAALRAAEELGAHTRLFHGRFLARLPHYDVATTERTADEVDFVQTLRAADAVIIGTPAYHAGVSALVKNALDLLQDLVRDDPPYLDGKPVGCVITAGGVQAAGQTLSALRAIVHALRAWPTPAAATLVAAPKLFDPNGGCISPEASAQLELVARQVLAFRRPALESGLLQAGELRAANSPVL